MRFAFVAPPNSGRREFAQTIHDKTGVEIVPSDDYLKAEIALDTIADYRAELALATQRSMDTRDGFFLHTLIDSLTYAVYRVKLYEMFGSVTVEDVEKCSLTAVTIGLIVKDSYMFDETFVLPHKAEPGTIAEEFESIQSEILDGFQIPHIITSDPDEVAEIIQRHQEK